MGNVKAIQTSDLRIIRSNTITRPADTNIYAAGDAISNVTTDLHFTFTNALRLDSKYQGEIVGARIMGNQSADLTNAAMSLALFNTDFTESADNAAVSISDTEARTYQGKISVVAADWLQGTLNMTAQADANLMINGMSSGNDTGRGDLYGQLIADAGWTPAASMTFIVDLLIR